MQREGQDLLELQERDILKTFGCQSMHTSIQAFKRNLLKWIKLSYFVWLLWQLRSPIMEEMVKLVNHFSSCNSITFRICFGQELPSTVNVLKFRTLYSRVFCCCFFFFFF